MAAVNYKCLFNKCFLTRNSRRDPRIMETTPGSKVMRELVEKYFAVPMHPFVHSTIEVNYSV